MKRIAKSIADALAAAYRAAAADYERRGKILLEQGIFRSFTAPSGYVLVVVLLITALLVSVSTEFLITAQTDISYITRFSDRLRAYYIARTGINLGRFILEADKRGMTDGLLPKNVDKNIDCYQDLWAYELPEIPIENGIVKISISDENAKINLSILSTEFVDRTPYYNIVQRFFMNMGFPIDFADTVIDWVDIDDSRSPYGAETPDYYQSLTPPYKAKNDEMDSINELLLVKGFTPEIFYGLGGGNAGKEHNLVDDNVGRRELNMALLAAMNAKDAAARKAEYESETRNLAIKAGKEKSRRLSDYFRVYGDRSDYLIEVNKFNINTASYRVLSALTDNKTDDIVTELIRRRTVQPFRSVSEVKDLITDEVTLNNIITVKSFIFRIQAVGRVNGATSKITVYYFRDEKKTFYWSEE